VFKIITECFLATAIIIVQLVSNTYRAKEEKLLALKCEARGMSPFYYKWEKYQPSNDSWIKPSDRAVNITSTKLMFTMIMEEDEGIYHCVVTNDDGSVVSDNATITVYGKSYSCIECVLQCFYLTLLPHHHAL